MSYVVEIDLRDKYVYPLISYLRKIGFSKDNDDVYRKVVDKKREADYVKKFVEAIRDNLPNILKWLEHEFPNLRFTIQNEDDIVDDRVIVHVRSYPITISVNPLKEGKKSITANSYKELKKLNFIEGFRHEKLIDASEIPNYEVHEEHSLNYTVMEDAYILDLVLVLKKEQKSWTPPVMSTFILRRKYKQLPTLTKVKSMVSRIVKTMLASLEG